MRSALQHALAAIPGAPPIVWLDNDLDDPAAPEAPTPPLPYWEAKLLPNRPTNDEYGRGYREIALFEIALLHRLGIGPGAADTDAELIRSTFFRSASLTASGQVINVDETPQVMPGYRDGDAWRTPVSIRVYSNNF